MTAHPLDLFSDGLQATRDRREKAGVWRVRYADGQCSDLPLHQWCGLPDPADRQVLSRCTDPTLDVGCGPGRLVAALSAEGRPALGIDVARAAVDLARATGAAVVRGSVFDALPAEGEWATVLLMDGNVGIGGNPLALLRRCGELLAPGGRVIVEFDPPESPSAAHWVRIEGPEQHSEWFRWAHVSADRAEVTAQEAGFRIAETWTRSSRWFGCLAR